MLKIDLPKIIEKRELNENDVAKLLFPEVKYAKLALRRVLKGEARLDSEQISKLAAHLGCSISALYNGGAWEARVANKIHIFKNGSYRAELNTRTWVTTLFHNESLFHEAVIHNGAITLSEYLNKLDLLILNNEKNENNN